VRASWDARRRDRRPSRRSPGGRPVSAGAPAPPSPQAKTRRCRPPAAMTSRAGLAAIAPGHAAHQAPAWPDPPSHGHASWRRKRHTGEPDHATARLAPRREPAIEPPARCPGRRARHRGHAGCQPATERGARAPDIPGARRPIARAPGAPARGPARAPDAGRPSGATRGIALQRCAGGCPWRPRRPQAAGARSGSGDGWPGQHVEDG